MQLRVVVVQEKVRRSGGIFSGWSWACGESRSLVGGKFVLLQGLHWTLPELPKGVADLCAWYGQQASYTALKFQEHQHREREREKK